MDQGVEIVRTIKINEVTVSLRSDGIVHVLIHRNVLLDVPLQMLMLRIYNEITEKKPHPFLYEGEPGIRVTREARDNAIRIELEGPGCAYALIARSQAYKILANFYVKVRRTKNPYRVFTRKDAAIRWLRQFVQQPAANSN